MQDLCRNGLTVTSKVCPAVAVAGGALAGTCEARTERLARNTPAVVTSASIRVRYDIVGAAWLLKRY
jgi:hypothetical protein